MTFSRFASALTINSIVAAMLTPFFSAINFSSIRQSSDSVKEVFDLAILLLFVRYNCGIFIPQITSKYTVIMQQEIWKDVVGYEGRYQVSDLGKVRSLFRYKKTLTHNLSRGYPILTLYSKIGRKSRTIHILVAKAFIPNPENKPQVNHINGIKTDNKVENLEWATAAENIQHGFRTKLYKTAGKRNCNAKLSVEQVTEIYFSECPLAELGRKFNVHAMTIGHIKRKKTYRDVVKKFPDIKKVDMTDIRNRANDFISSSDNKNYARTVKGYLRRGYIAGYNEAKAEIGTLREAVEKFTVQPYPETVFLPISDDEYTAIHEMLQEKFNMPIDRLAGHIGRELRKGIIEEAQQALKS